MPTMWTRLRAAHKDTTAPGQRYNDDTPKERAGSPYGYSFSIKGGPAPVRPPDIFVAGAPEQQRPSDHYVQQSADKLGVPHYPPQAGRDNYRGSGYRPASSIYSQPSPAAATFAAQQLRHDVYSDPHDISPPSSPDDFIPRNGPDSYDADDVSPIEETNNSLFIMDPPTPASASSRPPHQGRSNIPMMRRERRKTSDAAAQAMRGARAGAAAKQPRPHGGDVRWDPRTGEPTTSDKGRPSQVNPHQYVQGLSEARAPTGAPRQAVPPPTTPLGVHLKPVTPRGKTNSNADPTLAPAPKPEWRGASGRTTLVAPVADNKAVAPLHLPRKSSKRAARGPDIQSPLSLIDSETTSPTGLTAEPISPIHEEMSPGMIRTAQHTPARRPKAESQTGPYPSPPLSDGYSVPPSADQRGLPQGQPPAPHAHAASPQTLFPPSDKAIRRKPAAGPGHALNPSTSSSIYPQQEAPPVQPPAPAVVDDWVQPPSRFSVTTYATSAPDESPRPSFDTSDAPPIPTPPPKPAPGSSILDRKRPIVSGYEDSPTRTHEPAEPIKINMDDSPYMITVVKTRPSGPRPVPYGNHSALSVVSVSSVEKNLPPAPPEVSARNRVAQLNAKIEALGNRRININHAIRQMTQLMPTDNILASDAVIRKREEEKRKIETLKAELADVQREEYELGLKLHRAYKRMDRDTEFEPTTLWVRRASGH